MTTPTATAPAIAPSEQTVVIALGRVTARIQHQVEQVLKTHGLTLTQHNALRILNGVWPGGLCGTEIGQRMISEVPDMTRLLDRMAEAGLIERERDPNNRRFVHARITDLGRERVATVAPILNELHRKQLGRLCEAQRKALHEALLLLLEEG